MWTMLQDLGIPITSERGRAKTAGTGPAAGLQVLRHLMFTGTGALAHDTEPAPGPDASGVGRARPPRRRAVLGEGVETGC